MLTTVRNSDDGTQTHQRTKRLEDAKAASAKLVRETHAHTHTHSHTLTHTHTLSHTDTYTYTGTQAH